MAKGEEAEEETEEPEEVGVSESDFEEIDEAEFKKGGGRKGGSWKTEAIKDFAQKLSDDCEGKFIKYPIEKFYNNFRLNAEGSEVIKYASYYARKELMEALKKLGIKAEVKTMGTANNSTEGILKIHIIGE